MYISRNVNNSVSDNLGEDVNNLIPNNIKPEHLRKAEKILEESSKKADEIRILDLAQDESPDQMYTKERPGKL